jgi:hypothetical protein
MILIFEINKIEHPPSPKSEVCSERKVIFTLQFILARLLVPIIILKCCQTLHWGFVCWCWVSAGLNKKDFWVVV